MKHLQPIKSLLLTFIIIICYTSCSKDDVNANDNLTNITVKLKSTIGELDKVYLEIEDVQFRIKESTESNAWISLNTINRGTYNLFDLRDDSQLLLVDSFEIKSAYIYEIRLVLGDNNFIDLNNILYSLDVINLGNATPSNLMEIDFLSNRFYDLVIDIDVDESISFNEEENMMVLTPKIYTAIRQFEY